MRNLTWPAWEVSKKALVFPTAPGKPLPFQDEEFFKRMQDFLNTRQVRVPFGLAASDRRRFLWKSCAPKVSLVAV